MVWLIPVFVLLFPSFFIGNIYSHMLAKATIILVTTFLLARKIYIARKIKGNEVIVPTELMFLLGFYCIRLVMLFPQTDISLFLGDAQDILFYIVVIVYISLIHKKAKKYLPYSLFFFFLLCLINNILLYIFKTDYLNLWLPFIYKGSYDIALMNLNRDRVYFENFPELVIPFLLLFGRKHKLKQLFIFIGALFIVSVSGFRTNFVMVVVATLLTLYIKISRGEISSFTIQKIEIKKIVLIMTTVVVFFSGMYLAFKINPTLIQFNTIDRLLSQNTEDISTIESRFSYMKIGLDLFSSQPFIGVGTDRFKDYLTLRKDKYSFNRSNLKIYDDARDPHNMFITIMSEGGILALGTFLLFLVNSFLIDMKRKSIGSIAFWILILYGLANPVVGFLQFNILLVMFRFI